MAPAAPSYASATQPAVVAPMTLAPPPAAATPLGVGPQSPAGARFCHQCGQGLPPDSRFCAACGTPVVGPSAAAAAVTQYMVAQPGTPGFAVPPAAAPYATAQGGTAPIYYASPSAKPGGQHNGLFFGLGLLSVLLSVPFPLLFLADLGLVIALWRGAAGKRATLVGVLTVVAFLVLGGIAAQTIEMGSTKAEGRVPVLPGRKGPRSLIGPPLVRSARLWNLSIRPGLSRRA